MADNTKPLNWLDEVKADAKFITLKRMREADEQKAYNESKKNGTLNVEPELEEDPKPGQGATFDPKEEKKGK